MKRLLAILVISLASGFYIKAQEHARHPTPTPRPAATPVEADNSGWVRFNSDAGRFTVLVPQIPEDKTETVQSEHGPYTSHVFIMRDDSNDVYAIAWVDYDPSFNFNRRAELEANRDNFAKGISATVTSSQLKTIDGYEALEFTADTADRTFKSRVFLVGRRPYQIAIGFPKDAADTAPISRFLNSFKVRP